MKWGCVIYSDVNVQCYSQLRCACANSSLGAWISSRILTKPCWTSLTVQQKVHGQHFTFPSSVETVIVWSVVVTFLFFFFFVCAQPLKRFMVTAEHEHTAASARDSCRINRDSVCVCERMSSWPCKKSYPLRASSTSLWCWSNEPRGRPANSCSCMSRRC